MKKSGVSKRQARRPKPLYRPVCLACASFEVEAVVDGEPAQVEVFTCFGCQDVFYFLSDSKPRTRTLGLFELYE